MKRVVIVDDEYIVVEGIKAIIERENMDFQVVGCAYDGNEAVEVIRREKPDLVITDIRMPGRNGLDLIEKLEEDTEEMEFVIISGYQEFEYARKALQLGVRGYIDKPITIDSVREALSRVEEILNERSMISGNAKKEQAQNIYEEESAKLMDLVSLEQIENGMEQLEITLKCLRNYIPQLEEYKQECYKLVCLAMGIFFEKRREKNKEQRMPAYENVKNMNDFDEVDNFAKELFRRIFEKIRAFQMGGMHKTIEKVLSYLDENYNQDTGLTELAEMVGTNPAYLSLLFKEEVGMSFVKYLTKIRMEHAKKYLTEGYKVVEVAEMVGYSNYRYFCDIFKKNEGQTPNEYKGNVRKINKT